MKTLMVALLAGIFSFTMVAYEAEAKRFGGGKSFGRSAPVFQQRKAPSQTQQATRTTGARQPGAANSGSRRWLGPLAGLVAGGLIGAMLFGDMFEGFQFMDFLLILALAFGAFYLFRRLAAARARPAPMRREAYAGAHGAAPPVETPAIGSGLGGSDAGVADERPAWFDEAQFLQAAKTHFVRLQAAWDVGDMRDIRDYTTPQLFSELTLERQSYDGEKQFTEVVSVDAELLGVVREDDKLVAAVRYSGSIREEENADAAPFTEIWRIERDDRPNADWLVAGIEQSDRRS